MTFSSRTCNLSRCVAPHSSSRSVSDWHSPLSAHRSSRRRPARRLLHRPLDQILDVNVRDGLVYYRALKSERGRLDRYVASLNVPAATYEWLVARPADGVLGERLQRLRPADGRQSLSDPRKEQRLSRQQHPADSRRVRADHAARAAGRTVTLDEIEKTILPEFKEPRLYLALGRGAIGSGRLRSEAYTGDRLEKQLDRDPAGVRQRSQHVSDRSARQSGLGDADPQLARGRSSSPPTTRPRPATFAQRSPIERAIVAFIRPNCCRSRRSSCRRTSSR